MNFGKLTKKFVLFVFLFFSFFLLETGIRFKEAIISGKKLFYDVVDNQPKNFEKNYSLWTKNLLLFKKRILGIDKFTKNYLDKKYQLKKHLDLIEKVTLVLPDIFAKDGEKIYYVLLQNNMELRPSGGFMGSYAKMKFKDGGLNDVFVQDIYVPDGQIIGHVDPPLPIQEAFKQGWWKLRDANWDPDFPTAAKIIDWFFQKGNEEKADGIIAINLTTVKKVLKVIGPLFLVDYNQTVDSESFYQIIQSHSEIGFFPGSTQKKDILTAVDRAFFEKIKNLKQKETLKILQIAYQDLEERQILVSFFDNYLAKTFQKFGWDGSMKKLEPSTEALINDYFYLVEANLGANKANCCIERKISHEVDFSQFGLIKEKVKINFKNTGKYKEGIPPFFWGGTYNNYLRFYFPDVAKVGKVFIESEEVKPAKILAERKEDLGLQGIGFFVQVPAQSQKTVEINYEIPRQNFSQIEKLVYKLTIQKQPGIDFFPYYFKSTKNNWYYEFKENIRKDKEIIFEVGYNK